jgi:hypothetical protein
MMFIWQNEDLFSQTNGAHHHGMFGVADIWLRKMTSLSRRVYAWISDEIHS